MSIAALLLDNISDVIISSDLEYRITTWNKAAEEMFGMRQEEVLGKAVRDVVPYAFCSESREAAWKMLKEMGRWKGTVLFRMDAGKALLLELNSSTVRDHSGTVVGYVSIYRDVTDTYEMEQKLLAEQRRMNELIDLQKDMERQLVEDEVAKKRAIVKAIMEAQEKERREISSELHDNVNQILTTCKLFLEIARNNPADARFIDECYSNIQHVIEEIRNISHNLAPYSLKDLGLVAALHDTMQKINQSGKLTIRLLAFQNLEEERIGADIKLVLFRIIQEKINNVLKHSQGTELTIELSVYDGRIVVVLTDNGIGFDEKAVRWGMGLNNIRNRVEYYKGTMELRTVPGAGCELRVELPCNEAAAEPE